MVMNKKVGVLDPIGTVRTYTFPGNIQQRPTVPNGLSNITKQDYKGAPGYVCPDYWFWAWKTDGGGGQGGNVICRARLLADNSIRLDVIDFNLPFPATVYQITADYLTANATGGHVFIDLDFGPGRYILKFTITGDIPLTFGVTFFEFNQPGYPSADSVGGIALNKDHSRLSVVYRVGNNVGVCIVDANTLLQVAGSPLNIPLHANGETNVGCRLETDVWASSPNYGWQSLIGMYVPGGYVIHLFNPDIMAVSAAPKLVEGVPNILYTHSFKDEGYLCVTGLMASTFAQYSHAPQSPPASYGNPINDVRVQNIAEAYDVEKTGLKRFYGTQIQGGGALAYLRRWQSFTPPVTIDDVIIYTATNCGDVYAVACEREIRVAP